MRKERDDRSIPYTLFDSVEVPLPQSRGENFAFFRDLADKGPAATNLMFPRTLPNHIKQFQLSEINVSVFHWSGDDLSRQIWGSAAVELKINGKTQLEFPTRSTPGDLDFTIEPTDDIACSLRFDGNWSKPTTWEKVKEGSTEKVTFILPGWLQPVLSRLGIDDHFTREFSYPTERACRGSAIVTVRLTGRAVLVSS